MDCCVQRIGCAETEPNFDFKPRCRKRRHLDVERKQNASSKQKTSLIDLFEERRPGIFDLSYRKSHLDSPDEQVKGAWFVKFGI